MINLLVRTLDAMGEPLDYVLGFDWVNAVNVVNPSRGLRAPLLGPPACAQAGQGDCLWIA